MAVTRNDAVHCAKAIDRGALVNSLQREDTMLLASIMDETSASGKPITLK